MTGLTRIEVLTGTIGNDLSGTAPNANTSTTNQEKANLALTPNILLNGVVDVNGVPFLSKTLSPHAETMSENEIARKRVSQQEERS